MGYDPVVITLGLFIFGGLLIWFVWKRVGNKKIVNKALPSATEIELVLRGRVSFFQHLNAQQQETFVKRLIYFLQTTKISAEKGAEITDEHLILVAASATIPLFHFEHWSYENLDEVLIYPEMFNEKYNTEDKARNILGMVGDGAMHRKMILSLPALEAGFAKNASSNTAIHEFVHLIDKADGEVDGIPEYLIPKELVAPWLEEMHETISLIRRDKSDIRDYAATNQAEFLAVLSEYFFQKPKLLQEDHPELYELLNEIYSPKAAASEA